MNEANLLGGWNGIVESVALIAIVVLAIHIMVGVVKLKDILQRLGTILSVAILLIMLPAIMASLWASMTFWQRCGVVILGSLAGLLLWAMVSPRRTERK